MSLLSIIREKFSLLKDSPYEIYINFVLKFGEAYGYFTLSQILVIFLHEEFEISDVESGVIYGLWGAAITFWGFVTSCFNDFLGVRNSLLFGFMISMISNILIALNTNKSFLYFILFGLLPIGNSIGIPMLTIGIKRYTTKKNRGFAYGLFYAVMNIAALVSGPVVDFFNVVVCPSGSHCSSDYRRQGNGHSKMRLVTGNRLVIWTIVVVYFTAWCITFFYLREIKVKDEDLEEEDDQRDGQDTAPGRGRGKGVVSDSQAMVYTPLSALHASTEDGDEREDEAGDQVGLQLRDRRQAALEAGELADFNSSQKKMGRVAFLAAPLDSLPSARVRRGGYAQLGSDEAEEAELEEDAAVRNPLRRPSSSSLDPLDPAASADRSHARPLPTDDAASSAPGRPKQVRSAYSHVAEIVQSLTFWRFCLLTLFLINLNTIFRHVDATLPTYLLRCFGSDYPKGAIYSINPAMIIWLTPTVAAFTSHWPHFQMIKYGGYVSAVSPFFVAASTSTWAVVLFMVFLSLGEAIWSPRLYDYTMSIAPEGREATFSALAALPLFAAKIPVGLLSGFLLNKYLPEDGHTKPDGQSLWLVIGLLTLTSPLLITLCEPCIREPDRKQTARPALALAQDDQSSHSSSRSDSPSSSPASRYRPIQPFVVYEEDDGPDDQAADHPTDREREREEDKSRLQAVIEL